MNILKVYKIFSRWENFLLFSLLVGWWKENVDNVSRSSWSCKQKEKIQLYSHHFSTPHSLVYLNENVKDLWEKSELEDDVRVFFRNTIFKMIYLNLLLLSMLCFFLLLIFIRLSVAIVVVVWSGWFSFLLAIQLVCCSRGNFILFSLQFELFLTRKHIFPFCRKKIIFFDIKNFRYGIW